MEGDLHPASDHPHVMEGCCTCRVITIDPTTAIIEASTTCGLSTHRVAARQTRRLIGEH
jgi:hypothetical protein